MMMRRQQRWLPLLLLLLWPLAVQAQTFTQPPLTEAQYATLKTDITVTNAAEFQAQVAGNDFAPIAVAYNTAVTPVYWIYKFKVSRLEILFGTSPENTTFTFVGTGFPAAEIERWRELFSRGDDSMAPSLKTVRDALLDIFKGTGEAQANRVHIGHQSRKEVTRAERLYVTSGTGTKGDPGVAAWTGTLTDRDVSHALTGAPLQ